MAKENRIQILIKPSAEFGVRTDVAIHMKSPTYDDLLDGLERAERGMFNLIVMYTDKSVWKMGNLKASQSTWNKLRRDFGDVRFGEVGPRYTSLGTGFTIYFDEVA